MDADLSIGKGLAGKVAIVTGATSGIGRATALLYARVGVSVVAVGRNRAQLDSLKKEIERPDDHLYLESDLEKSSSAQEIVAATLARYGTVYILAHVAASLRRRSIWEVSEADWDYQFDVNLKSTFLLNRAVARVMVDQKVAGNIVNFTSGSWIFGPLFGADAYSASKAGIVTFSRGLARQFGKYGIRVNTISPGQIDTPMQHSENTEANVKAVAEACPLGRIGQPEEIASVTVFVTSDHGSFIHGATLNVSGGSLLY